MEEKEIVDEEKETKKSGGGKKAWIIIPGILLILGLSGGFFIYSKFLKSTKDKKKIDLKKKEKKVKEEYTLSLNPFIVNLADREIPHYLKISISLGFYNKDLDKKIETNKTQIRDTVILALSEKKYQEIMDIKGKKTLKNELLLKLKKILGKGSLNKIYFTEFVIQ
ncbi:MAG: flagellar basal body-associated FliL family protein [Thermodesulfobacteriota bacterium]|nr:flagellar basal body-associated FliL family protein [Thermodesulfobacteriota bacterium]